ncbi:DUF1345 domain-containing protein [Tenggerimyces flavus]|uniref:DUF1345 domain-containing protein n=1 Tax=Tenggerimyces flavus TaxID=1708749 RepID=A0ABV7YJ82_9ACTN|nr:DUF1345 domain-containing protein [Tenggerimyces flavus]MBM7787312.1 putative membrane protein [Tenggerimyces flavus]
MRWWNREFPRQSLASVLASPGLLIPGAGLVKLLAVWGLYAVAYLLLTWLTFRGHEPVKLRTVALATRAKHPVHRWIGTSPEQVSQVAAGIAMLATVQALPRAQTLDAPPTLVLGICVLAIVGSWVTLQTGFVVTYLRLYAETGGLEFPGEDEPNLIDFAYFAVSVGTTFGTTDVTVTQSRVRRQVLAHGVLAFFFNTLILAAAVTFVASYLTG